MRPAGPGSVRRLILGVLAALSACDAQLARRAAPEAEAEPAVTARNFDARTYERTIVFTTLKTDTALVVPWLLTTRSTPEGEDREVSGWLARGNVWDAFLHQRWRTPPVRSPQRPLPHGPFRAVVAEGGSLAGLVYRRAERALEVGLGPELASWGGPAGETVRLREGILGLAGRRTGGVVLDLARAARDSHALGDRIFLVSGDSVQVVLAGSREHDPAAPPPPYLAWARVDLRRLQWADVAVTWEETSAFHPARRDVPVAWRVEAGERGPRGAFRVTSADVQPGEGEGPILPVRAVYLVEGTLELEGTAYPARGVLLHERR